MPEGTEEVQPGAAAETPPEVVEATVSGTENPAPGPEATEDGEPGGKSPLEIARRKEYERRIEAERDKARLEGELKVLREQLTATPKREEQREFTAEEVETAIQQGTISRAEGTEYLVQKAVARAEQQRAQREQAQKPLEKAKSEVDEYLQLYPELRDTSSDLRRKADAEAERLAQYGYPRNVFTDRQALENVVGRIDQVRARRESERLTRENGRPAPADGGAGNLVQPTNGKVDISRAPAHLVAYWEKTGTSEKDRQTEMAYWVKNQGRKAGQVRR